MRIGFIGGWGHHYLRGLLKQPAPGINLDLPVAVAPDGSDAQAAERLGTSLADPKWFDDAGKMLDSYRPEVVSIGAVYALNARWILECLRRGIPVVSDKPIAATWDDFEAIHAAASAQGAPPLITEFEFRARPEVRAARQAVAQGALGEIALVTAQKSYRFGTRPQWYADRATYGGTVLWIASHAIDLIRYTTGLRALTVTGRQHNVTHPDYGTMEDHTVNLYELENGASAVAHADLLRAEAAPTHGDDRLRIVGSKGTLEMMDRKTLLTTHDAPPRDISQQGSSDPAAWLMLRAALGEPSDAYSTQESLATARLLLHSRDAADRQAWVHLTADDPIA